MKTLYKILGLFAIDYVIIWLYVYKVDPSPSISIAIIYLVPFVFLINLVISGLFILLKRKSYSKIFILNSVIASILMYYLFIKGIDRQQNNILESWEFQKADTTFSIIRWKKTNKFSISYSLRPGASWGFLDGECEMENNEWILTSDSLKMKIIKDKLVGFRNELDTIEITKLKR